MGLASRLAWGVTRLAGLVAGEAGGVRPAARLLGLESLKGPTGLLVGVDLAATRVLLGATLGSAAFGAADTLEAELLLFTVVVGLVCSGFLAAAGAAAAAAVDVVGFLAAAAGGGRLTSGEEQIIRSFHSALLNSSEIVHFRWQESLMIRVRSSDMFQYIVQFLQVECRHDQLEKMIGIFKGKFKCQFANCHHPYCQLRRLLQF